MPEELWHYLENQFDNSTKNSRKRAHAQGIYHQNSIPNAPGTISPALTQRFITAWTPFNTGYLNWLNLRGQQKGATQSLEASLDSLGSEDIESIETDFKVAFRRGTPEHTSAFPQGREPFQQGGIGARKAALDALVTRLGQLVGPLDAALADAIGNGAAQDIIDALTLRSLSLHAARATALARQSSIQQTRALQDGLQSQVELAAEGLDTLRVTFCDALYGNLAQLMLQYFPLAQREQVTAFFDLELLQQDTPEEEDPAPILPVPPTP